MEKVKVTMREQRKANILTALTEIPWMDSKQLATFCGGNSPQKRVSELLKELEKEKMIEGQSRAIGQTKVWRLGVKGRKELSPRLVKPFGVREMEHILGMGEVYLWLKANGGMRWKMELREDMGNDGIFCPDAFFVFGGIAFFLEYQLSPLSSEQWRQKWRMYEKFYMGHLPNFSERSQGGKILKPRILVLSHQMESTVKQTALPFYQMKEIAELPALL